MIRTTLITGGTQGLGAAIARRFLADGHRVVVNGIGDAEALAAAVEAMRQETGGDVTYVAGDLSVEQEVWRLAGHLDGLGGVDILVNNAAVRHFHPIETLPLSAWQTAMAVNVTAPFQLIQRALPHMRRQGWGRIINISSVLAVSGRAERADYVASKSAIAGLTRAVAAETAGVANITCNAIAPGTLHTDHIDNRIAQIAEQKSITRDEARGDLLRSIGQRGDLIDPARLAGFIAYLCRDEARDIDGAFIPFDTGLSATWLNPPL